MTSDYTINKVTIANYTYIELPNAVAECGDEEELKYVVDLEEATLFANFDQDAKAIVIVGEEAKVAQEKTYDISFYVVD